MIEIDDKHMKPVIKYDKILDINESKVITVSKENILNLNFIFINFSFQLLNILLNAKNAKRVFKKIKYKS